jgi:rRNA-processing protein FCF1
MKKIIIVDTNYLYPDFKKLRIQELEIEGFECYIPMLVIEELKGLKAREIKKEYKLLNEIANSEIIKKSFSVDIHGNIYEVLESFEKDYEKSIKEYFSNKIINYNSLDNSSNELMNRVKYKIPPFIDEKGSSDKGFMDSLIWLNVLSFAKENKNIKITFITNDKNAFYKNKEELIQEFSKNSPDNHIEFYRDFEFESFMRKEISNQNINDKSELLVANKEIHSRRLDKDKIIEIRNKINNILYSVEEYSNGYPVNNFKLEQKIDENNTEILCDLISNSIADYIFDEYINMDIFFDRSRIKYYKSQYNVSQSDLIEFVNIYNEIKSTYYEYIPAFIKYMTRQLNEMVIQKKSDNEDTFDLPF